MDANPGGACIMAIATFHSCGLRAGSPHPTLPAKVGGSTMAPIKTIEAGHYRIPLSVTLSDSTHGEITAFELLTIRIRDTDGAEGVGYTYTVGRNGGAVADTLRREVPALIA